MMYQEPYVEVIKTLSPIQFKMCFTSQERIAIKALKATDELIEDAYEIFNEIDLSQYELYINAGGNNSLIIGLLEGMLVANSRKSSDLHGLIGANPLGELASKGRLPSSLNSMYDELAKVVKWSQRNTPELRTILIDGQVFSDGGASAVQELGYCLATGISYIRALQQRGLEVNVICKQIFRISL